MTWSLEQAYEQYPQIEEEFSAALDDSMYPRGPDLLNRRVYLLSRNRPEL